MDTPKTITLQYWEPNPDKPGYLRHVGNPTYREVYRELYKALENEGLIDEYFSNQYDTGMSPGKDKSDTPIPNFRWVACWAVVGGSEGHYIHVELVYPDDAHKHFIHEAFALGKTFQGWDHAWTIARRCAELMNME